MNASLLKAIIEESYAKQEPQLGSVARLHRVDGGAVKRACIVARETGSTNIKVRMEAVKEYFRQHPLLSEQDLFGSGDGFGLVQDVAVYAKPKKQTRPQQADQADLFTHTQTDEDQKKGTNEHEKAI
jgi:hypothetical protein